MPGDRVPGRRGSARARRTGTGRCGCRSPARSGSRPPSPTYGNHGSPQPPGTATQPLLPDRRRQEDGHRPDAVGEAAHDEVEGRASLRRRDTGQRNRDQQDDHERHDEQEERAPERGANGRELVAREQAVVEAVTAREAAQPDPVRVRQRLVVERRVLRREEQEDSRTTPRRARGVRRPPAAGESPPSPASCRRGRKEARSADESGAGARR